MKLKDFDRTHQSRCFGFVVLFIPFLTCSLIDNKFKLEKNKVVSSVFLTSLQQLKCMHLTF